jgi:hypothetical protein
MFIPVGTSHQSKEPGSSCKVRASLLEPPIRTGIWQVDKKENGEVVKERLYDVRVSAVASWGGISWTSGMLIGRFWNSMFR